MEECVVTESRLPRPLQQRTYEPHKQCSLHSIVATEASHRPCLTVLKRGGRARRPAGPVEGDLHPGLAWLGHPPPDIWLITAISPPFPTTTPSHTMSSIDPDREGSHFDESRIDNELEHQLRRRNVAHAELEAAAASPSRDAGDVGYSGPAAGGFPTTATSTAHSFDQQLQNIQEQPTPTPTVPLPEYEVAEEPSARPPVVPGEASEGLQPSAVSATEQANETKQAEEARAASGGVTSNDAEAEGAKERSCRICFGGVDEEGEMGRLISPCLCSGSMRYVHVQCLGMWRAKNSKTFIECPQCKYTYVLRRGRWGDVLLSTRTLTAATATTFLLMSLITGHFLLHFLLNLYQKGTHSSSAVGTTWESEDGSMVVYMGGATFILDLIDDSINAFIAITARAFDMFEGSRWVTPLMLDFILRFLLGVALLGALSALSLLGSLRLLAPLQLLYTISLSGIVDISPALSIVGGSRNVIVGFVLLGVANSIVQVYDALHACALFALRFTESEIVEPSREQATQRKENRSWGRKWLRDRRWRTVDGWQEVWRRSREKFKRQRPVTDAGREVLVQMAAEAQPQQQPGQNVNVAADRPAEQPVPVVEPVNAVAAGEALVEPVLPGEHEHGLEARPEVEIPGQ